MVIKNRWLLYGLSVLCFVSVRGYALAVSAFSEAKRSFGLLVHKLFSKTDRVLWARALPVLFVNPAVYLVKFDKVKEYFSFLRVKQSWIAG